MTLAQAFAFYDPIIAALHNSGTKILLILNQETFWGNGPWDNGNWSQFSTDFAGLAATIALHYKGQITAYEIWNEGDVQGQPTSVYVPPEDYGPMLALTTHSIRATDSAAKVVSGGLAGGDIIGYMTKVRTACGGVLPCDGIGYHPYGKTPPNTIVFNWTRNTLQPALQAISDAFRLPIWITEMGVAGVNVTDQSLWPTIGTYLRSTFTYIRSVTNICPVLIWFAWSDNQDGAGIVTNAQVHKAQIWDAYAQCTKDDNPNPKPPPVVVTPPTTPAAKSPSSLIGGYIMQGGEWFLQDMKTLSDAGKPISAVMSFRLGWSSEATPTTIKQASPQTIVIERWYWSPNVDWSQLDLYAVGAELMIDYYNTFPVSHTADFIYIINEPMPGPGFATFWNGVLDEAEKRGLHVCVGNFPETWPALPGETDSDGKPKYYDQFWTLPDVHALIARIIAEGHCLSWHEYIIPDPNGPWDSGYSMGRADKIIALLPAELRNVLIILTEWGTGTSQGFGDGQIVDGFNAGDTFAHALIANVKALIAWCIGPWTDSAHPKVNSDLGFHRDALLTRWHNAKF